MIILAIAVGLALAFFGRQLFWLFVGGIGFAAGMSFASGVVEGQSDWVTLLIAIAAGIVGALLAIFLQRFAIGLGGFVAGGYATLNLLSRSGEGQWGWIAFILGGILGALLVIFLFDWALIFLSSVTGALLVADSLKLEPQTAWITFLGLTVAGIAVQATQMRRTAAATRAPVETDRP
jgi:hypothetical protein